MEAPSGSWRWNEPVLWSRLLLFIASLTQVVAAAHFWNLTWDDSAITIGFSHTLATTGRIEPTAGSGIVEGYSTTLWMLLIACLGTLFHSPATLLNLAKILTLTLNLLNIYLIRRWVQDWGTELLANLTAGVIGCTLMFYETINGMETPMLMTLLLLMLLARKRYYVYLILGAAVTLLRFESLWILIPFMVTDRSRKRALSSVLVWGGAFATSELFRLLYFHAALPNTITAKRHAPYSSVTAYGELMRHLHEPVQILRFLFPWALIASVPLITRIWRKRPTVDQGALDHLKIPALIVIFCFVLSTAIGTNWGPPMRSFYPAWPFALALVMSPLLLAPDSLMRRISVLLICGLALWLATVRWKEMERPFSPAYMPGATVANVSRSADAISYVQAATHTSSFLYAGPDMGAILIKTKGLRVLDLGLLCNQTLATQGYGAVRSYVFQQRHPDLIEIHEPWTSYTNIRSIPEFRRDYLPLHVDGYRFFLRRTDLTKIDRERLSLHAAAHRQADTDDLDELFGEFAVLN